jgi:hypothetical protein
VGPLLNPVTLLITLFLWLGLILVMALPIPVVSLLVGVCYVLIKGQKEAKAKTAILATIVVASVLLILMIPLAKVGFFVLWLIAGLLMVS